MAQPEGIPFGNYRLLKRLARGGMAEVFLARQGGLEGFHRVVAVKRILPHLVDSREFVRMFLDEARLAARLTHPNIVHIYEFGKVDEHFFIAMEFVDGIHTGQLVKHAHGGEPIPFELVARVGADACAGLRYAHALTDEHGRKLGLVHRDISPPNLMVTFDGVVKLVDFGIAKAVTSAEHTRPGVIKGKFAYMSPEQCTGQRLTGRSDVFSLGIVLWELLASRIAISRDDPVEGMRKIRDGKLEPIEQVRPDVPPALAHALRRALEIDYRKRATGAELAAAFEEYLKQAPRMATSAELGDWVRDRFPRMFTTGSMPALSGTHAVQGTVQGTAQGTVQATASSVIASEPPPTHATAPTTLHATATVPGFGSYPPADLEPPTQVVEMPPSFASGQTLPSLARRPRPRRGARRALIIGAFATAALVAGVIGLGASNGELPQASPPAPTPTPAVAGSAPADAAPADAARVAVEAPPDATPAYAQIDIITRPPGAAIELDGEPQDDVTPVGFRELTPGEHSFVAALDGYQPVERTVRVGAGERRTLELQLVALSRAQPEPRAPKKVRPPAFGRLSARTTPWSHVYMNGRKLGTTPFANIKLPTGTHTLVFKNPKKGSRSRKVTIRPGKTTKLSFSL